MSEYIVPDGDEVNFVLLDYLVPDGDEVNFRFGTIEKVFDDTSETSDDIDLEITQQVAPSIFLLRKNISK
jgi:hypothetical protein